MAAVANTRTDYPLSTSLLSYGSELNPIEGQWHQLKNHELAGRMFEYEDDLAEVIVDGMIDRSERCGYALDRFIFNLV